MKPTTNTGEKPHGGGVAGRTSSGRGTSELLCWAHPVDSDFQSWHEWQEGPDRPARGSASLGAGGEVCLARGIVRGPVALEGEAHRGGGGGGTAHGARGMQGTFKRSPRPRSCRSGGHGRVWT